MSELSAKLSDMFYEKGTHTSNKIEQVSYLSGKLKELEAGLHHVGISVGIGRNTGNLFRLSAVKEENLLLQPDDFRSIRNRVYKFLLWEYQKDIQHMDLYESAKEP